MSTKTEWTITLPTDEARVGKLKRKLDEYKTRKTQAERENDALVIHDSICKIAILESLLVNNTTDYDTMHERVFGGYGKKCMYRFEPAFRVIKEYCETGGRGCVGGTRLK